MEPAAEAEMLVVLAIRIEPIPARRTAPGSRLPAANSRMIGAPFGIVTPATSMSPSALRVRKWTGGS